MRILTNDPSITAWGWVVLELQSGMCRIIDTGCIKTESEAKKKRIRKSDDLTRRLSEISSEVNRVCDTHKVEWIVAEAPHGSQSAVGAKMIGAVTGILSCLAVVKKLPIEWYSEADAKKHLSGRRSLSKKDTIDCIINIYGDKWYRNVKYKDEAVADALAVFHVGRSSSPALIHALNS